MIGKTLQNENLKKSTDLPEVTDKLYHLMLYQNTPHNELDSNSQLYLGEALIAKVDINPTTI